MTIAEVMAQVDELKPNQYDDTLKISWISKVEGKIVNDIINTHESSAVTSTTATTDSTTDSTSTTTEGSSSDDIEFNGYTEDDYDTTLMVPDEYCDLYLYYIYAMIDFTTGEFARYANSMVMFNTAYSEYSHWYNRTHKPKTNVLKLF